MQRAPTSANIASTNTSTLAQPVTFVPLGGQNVSVSFGDGSANATITTALDGMALISHTYAALGTYNASATFTGGVGLQSLLLDAHLVASTKST